MPRATCRCGEPLTFPGLGPDADRVVCPRCGSRVRVRRRAAPSPPPGASADGFIRFDCPCGRRLKVSATNPPPHGQCPDCRRVVPVPDVTIAPSLPPGHPETPTAELNPADRMMLERWTRDHVARRTNRQPSPSTSDHLPARAAPPSDRAEVGLRVCPRCRKPVHLGAEVCRNCGTPVPRR